MFIVESYTLSILFCVVTMFCWGSWGNTQKLAAGSWRYEFFYWDYVWGIVLLALVSGFTLGSTGTAGRPFLEDLAQLDAGNAGSAFLGGIIFNASNILLTASVALAGMSVAFPVGVGLALVLGVIINYIGAPKGDPVYLFAGVLLVVAAIILNGVASGRVVTRSEEKKTKRKGILLAILAGVLMSFFYRFVAASMDLENLYSPTPGMATPYSAFFVFSTGILVSNLLFNTLLMKKPVSGTPVTYRQYVGGRFSLHLVGVLGGVVWGIGTALSYLAAGKAGAAISYALGQGAPMIAALWGICVWKEFKGGPRSNNWLLTGMILLFLSGLGLIVYAGAN
ncbi:MAG: GRP family sugar transporter [Tannerellaceae bacterium]|nr:GRP family sugar transporter [Tannerellaceae bacterium]